MPLLKGVAPRGKHFPRDSFNGVIFDILPLQLNYDQ
jgi:hypothetical protein